MYVDALTPPTKAEARPPASTGASGWLAAVKQSGGRRRGVPVEARSWRDLRHSVPARTALERRCKTTR